MSGPKIVCTVNEYPDDAQNKGKSIMIIKPHWNLDDRVEINGHIYIFAHVRAALDACEKGH